MAQDDWKTTPSGAAAIAHMAGLMDKLDGAAGEKNADVIQQLAVAQKWRRDFDFSGVPDPVMSGTRKDLLNAADFGMAGDWVRAREALDRARRRW
jgi:hypothetical protein